MNGPRDAPLRTTKSLRFGRCMSSRTSLRMSRRLPRVCRIERDSSHDRRGLEDRVGPAHRRPRADRARRRPGRGARPGRSRRRARAVARVGRPGQPGRLAHGHREASRDRSRCAATSCSSASTRRLGREIDAEQIAGRADLDAALDDDIGDDLLRLVFIACHPVLSTEARVALTLRLLGGLTTEEIARAFLVAGADRRPAHRARQAHARRGARPLRGPARGRARGAACRRCSKSSTSIFNEGYAATAGDDWMRPALCEDALRLGRILAELAPRRARGPRPRRADGDPGVALEGARRPVGRAHPAARSEPRPLGSTPHPARPRRARARRSSSAARAGPTPSRPRSPPATRARARRTRPTGRASPRSTTQLAQLAPSPVVELNRAVAVAHGVRPGRGPRARRCARLASRRCRATTCLPSVRGDLLVKLGRFDEARAEFERAAALTRNARRSAGRRAGRLRFTLDNV